MKYSEVGFRAFYNNFIAVPLKDNLKDLVGDFPGADKANYILTYGYIDHTTGLTLEVLAAAFKGDEGFLFAAGNTEISLKIRIGSVMDDECFYFDDEDGKMYKSYADKIESLKIYYAGDEVEESRNMRFLDPSRSPEHPDDLLVYLLKDENELEGCWVRIEALGEHNMIGTLLNEPDQDFDCHAGDKIEFYVQQKDDEEIVLWSNMNTSTRFTAKDLEDGRVLEAAIHTFHEEPTEKHLLDIMAILADSYVWIPCNTIMSDADQARLAAMDLKIGEEFTSHDQIRLIPDVLQRGDEFFFPVFSNIEAMGDYGNGFSKVQKHFLEALVTAKNNERDLAGIVINAFSEPCILDKELWNLVEEMKSRIQK
ncbi:SseB family protein [uncultured Ezakiella sp.]|uniref:SseB family protein n=1 Tax=uncultured Ezakiella sp. TaxID=1637529 RepID=UPI0025E1686F|nr:SseB family protein [uncultured Ezakiella sp.]